MLMKTDRFVVLSSQIIGVVKDENHYDRHPSYTINIYTYDNHTMHIDYDDKSERDLAYDLVVASLVV